MPPSAKIMWMIGIGRTGTLRRKWNVDGLGWAKVNKDMMAKAAVLHWSGKTKGVCECEAVA